MSFTARMGLVDNFQSLLYSFSYIYKPIRLTLKTIWTFLVVLLLASTAQSQLINAGFESYSSLPTNTGQFSRALGWYNAGSTLASPDYYHYSASSAADIPQTPMAYLDAYEGNAIMGFCATGRPGDGFREYLSTQFDEPLEVGKEYILSWRMTNGEKTDVATSGLATSKLGVHLSTAAPAQNETNFLNHTPQLRIDTLWYSKSWNLISFSFIADQPYNFLTLGVFFSDGDIQIVDKVPGNSQYAYYFVDDFFLKQVPDGFDPIDANPPRDDSPRPTPDPQITAIEPFFIPNSFTPNGDGQNDIFIPIAGTVKNWEICIYSHWGDKVFYSSDSNLGWDGIYEGKNAPSGCYVWEVSYSVSTDEFGEGKNIRRGLLHLIR